jgi:hypothetical protein
LETVLITETVPDDWFVTYTREPSGLTTTPDGLEPTVMVVSKVFVAVFTTATVPLPFLQTYTLLPSGLTAIPSRCTTVPNEMVATTELVDVLITDTLPLLAFAI